MRKLLCHDHRHREKAPLACHICARIKLEWEIVVKVVDKLLRSGYELSVYSEDPAIESYTTDRQTVLSLMMEVDDEFLYAIKDGKRSWVRFVYGNDGYDVISDYTTDLEDVLAPIQKWIDDEVAP